MNLFHRSSLDHAQALLATGKVAEAIPFFIRAIEENRDVAVASFQLGVAYRLMGNIADAEKAFSLSVTTNPANSKAWECLALTQSELNKEELALSSAERSFDVAFDDEQKAMAKMALLQALAVRLRRVGEHNEDPKQSFEIKLARGSVCDNTASRMLRTIEDCSTCGHVPKEELWKFYTLVGIYTFKSSISKVGFEQLRSLRSRYFVELIKHYIDIYRFPDGVYPTVGLPADYRTILYPEGHG